MRLTRFLLVAGLAWALPPAVFAQGAAYPARPIHILVGSPPGGPSDIVTRLFAEQLTQRFKQPVVVENRPGAGNSLAAGIAAKAEPDGYTLALSPDTVVTVNPLVYPKLNFDARTDLVNISIMASFTQMLVCNAGKGVRSAGDLVERARREPMTYASGGPGVPGHLAAEMFLQTTGIRMAHVPYRGPAPATLAVLAGEVDCGFLATPTVMPHVKSGKLAALAVSSVRPSPLAPEVPTLAQALHQPTLDITFNLVLQAAKGTPASVIAVLERAAMDAMARDDVRAKLQASDLVPVGSTSADAETAVRAETVRWAPIVRRLDIKSE